MAVYLHLDVTFFIGFENQKMIVLIMDVPFYVTLTYVSQKALCHFLSPFPEKERGEKEKVQNKNIHF